jgi:hypothetical protein
MGQGSQAEVSAATVRSGATEPRPRHVLEGRHDKEDGEGDDELRKEFRCDQSVVCRMVSGWWEEKLSVVKLKASASPHGPPAKGLALDGNHDITTTFVMGIVQGGACCRGSIGPPMEHTWV